ncbi:MAG: flagellar filament capping protein FliD [Smithellaceae bacterium]
MTTSTNLISGLSSGFDWQGMISQLMEVEHQKVDLVTERKTEQENKLKEWQSVNTNLLTLKTAAKALSTASAFNVFSTTTSSNTSTAASDIFTVTADETASAGTYNIKVSNLAEAEKISSKSYSTTDTPLGLSGDILISGKVVNIVSTDTLASIKDKINAVNTGSDASNVTASIVSHSATDHHLILSSDVTGATGLQILGTSSTNLLQSLGLISASTTIKNTTSNGAKSDLFTDSNSAVGTLLGLSSAPGSTSVTIGGNAVSIDLSSESLTTIAANIDALAGISASVVSEEVDGETKYRINISGTTSFTDTNNVLQTLGILKGTYSTVAEVLTGATANTTDGSTAITAATQWSEISGANVQAGTSFTMTGKKNDGTAVSGSFTISGTGATVQELLTYIQTTLFGGGVTAAIDSSGKIQVTDSTTGDSRLELNLTTNNPAGGSLDFGTIATSTEGRNMQITAGEDAEINVDNVTLTRSSNIISDVIEGAALNLAGASLTSTVTLKIERDISSIKTKMQSMVSAFNTIMNYINTQFTYNEKTKETGGVLFGDGTLSSVKSDLINTVTKTITGVSSDYNRLALIGISFDDSANLVVDDTKLTNALKANFDDVRKLFAAYGTATNPQIQYVSHTDDTQGGTYPIDITQAATQTTLTGTNVIAGTLGTGETLSIADVSSGRTASIALTSSMTLADIVNAINSELAKETTQQLTGGTATGFTANTLFSSISGADNGDVITFSGTRSNGVAVSGSYIISTSDNLGNLLSEIESMFEGDVTASINGTGQLVITDKLSGDSSTTLSINTSAVSGLDFGTISEATTGRYAVPITASASSDNKLVLTHNYYGTGHALNVSESGTALGISSINQVYGLNIAGTINGVTATGIGQTLSLSSSGNSADGLSIMYSGTIATSSNFNMILGTADLLDRQLGYLTNTTDGYVYYKQTSIQNSIDSFETQITQMEALLEQKQETMTNRFVAMEVALQKLQSQSSWLTSQTASLLTPSSYI